MEDKLHVYTLPMVQKSDNRVLVIDDSPIYRHLILGHLREWGFEAIVASTGAEGWKILQKPTSPNLVLLDWVMPEMDGVELCQKLRSRPSTEPYIYTILLTSKEGRTDLLKAMKAGVDDYLVKPFDEQELKARLLVGKRIVDLQEELVEAREAMRHAATYDGLTGILNRSQIMDYLRRELDRSSREKRPVSVIMADIDHFKAVNDQLGHAAGDEVLKEVANRLRSQLRTYDGVGRYGGEEFLLVLPGCDLTSGLIRADQIRTFVSRTSIKASVQQRTVTVSMGVAVADGKNPIEMQPLLALADRGLYLAKSRGRNRVEQLDDGADDLAVLRQKLAARAAAAAESSTL